MYETIYHPKKQKWVSLKSRSGGRVLARYMRQLQCGGAKVPEKGPAYEGPAYYEIVLSPLLKLMVGEKPSLSGTLQGLGGLLKMRGSRPTDGADDEAKEGTGEIDGSSTFTKGTRLFITDTNPEGDEIGSYRIEVITTDSSYITQYTVIYIDKTEITNIQSPTHKIKTINFSTGHEKYIQILNPNPYQANCPKTNNTSKIRTHKFMYGDAKDRWLWSCDTAEGTASCSDDDDQINWDDYGDVGFYSLYPNLVCSKTPPTRIITINSNKTKIKLSVLVRYIGMGEGAATSMKLWTVNKGLPKHESSLNRITESTLNKIINHDITKIEGTEHTRAAVLNQARENY